MKCSNYCAQGRLDCPTPTLCGLASTKAPRNLHTANSDGSSAGRGGGFGVNVMPVWFVGAEPPDEETRLQRLGWAIVRWGLLAVSALCTTFTLALAAGYITQKWM